ncbi:MAG: metallophosphoesterase [Planctomycetota bacterium]|jgi:hypothetical protein
MRTLIFGDVHGCASELRALIAAFDPRPGDRLVSVGDLIRKGPDSPGVVRTLRGWTERGVRVEHVLGNHEVHLRRSLRSEDGGSLERDLRSLVEALTEQELEWLLRAPLHLHDPSVDARVIHAGVLPGWTTLPDPAPAIAERGDAERMDTMVRVRSLAGPDPRRRVTKVRGDGGRGRTLDLALDLPLPKAPPGGHLEIAEVEVEEGSFLGLREIGAGDVNWPTLYDGRFGHIYFGHQPFLKVDAPMRFPHATGLDLGCVYGGWLAAVVLEPGREPSPLLVAAEAEYSRWGF